MRDVMIDLETLGTLPGSAILSIGAVEFDCGTGQLGRELYSVVSRAECELFGLIVMDSTLDWWLKQSPEARKVLTEAESDSALPLADALGLLNTFIPKDARVWSNGANFDQPVLDVAYSRIGQGAPWKYWNSRCYRTIIALCKDERAMRPPTICAHNALEDAKWQAQHLMNVVRHLGLPV